MEIPSITAIRNRRDEIREVIKEIDVKLYHGQTFGSEDEYSYKSLLGGIEALLTDITTLLRSPIRFIKISTYSERSGLISSLTNIKLYLDSPSNLYAQVDQLKLLLRPYNLRFFEDRFIEFETEIDEARKIKINLQEDKVAVEKIIDSIKNDEETVEENITSSKTKFEELELLITELTDRKESIETKIEALEEKNEEILKMKDGAVSLLEIIKDSATESSTNEKLIRNFASTIQKSEANVVLLDSRLAESEKKLTAYEEERKNILKDANSLIESSRQALNYTTAQGISASFKTKHDDSVGFWKVGAWLFAAGTFMTMIIGISFWILLDKNITTNILIGRILMVPILSIGLYFCISQYNKQKNIIEDYAYKTVIATAIVGFSEQIKKHESENTDEYVSYMKTALGEIHQDPLRERGKSNNTNNSIADIDANKTIELFQKFASIFKS